MTELEKVSKNQYEGVDYNKLIEELCAFNDNYTKAMQVCSANHAKPPKQILLQPACNYISVLNAIINASYCTNVEIPFVVAALEILKNTISMHLDEIDKEMAKAVVEIITPGMTSINIGPYMKREENK